MNRKMPGSGDYHRNRIIEVVGSGQISPEALDEVVETLLAVYSGGKRSPPP